ncbi:MAG: hypothetical protein WCL61_03665 [bacterium]
MAIAERVILKLEKSSKIKTVKKIATAVIVAVFLLIFAELLLAVSFTNSKIKKIGANK